MMSFINRKQRRMRAWLRSPCRLCRFKSLHGATIGVCSACFSASTRLGTECSWRGCPERLTRSSASSFSPDNDARISRSQQPAASLPARYAIGRLLCFTQATIRNVNYDNVQKDLRNVTTSTGGTISGDTKRPLLGAIYAKIHLTV
jgi:hypothetical protein